MSARGGGNGVVDGGRHRRLLRQVTERAQRRGFPGWAGLVCDVAVTELAVDAAAITLRTSARAQELAAASGQCARRLEEIQYTVGVGPGVEAFDMGSPVLMADLAEAHQRWPGFEDAAVADGVSAVFAFPLLGGAVQVGVLDLYRRRPGELSADQLADAAVLADLATTALLTDAAPHATAGRTWDDLPGHYDDVNVATGVLAAELQISVENAFLRLRAHAFSTGQAVLDVAHAVLSHQFDVDAFQD
ncbi:GAF and ANTAR domain-containing protein [Kibdelosporangium aridum]|uniref:ANTAR domain-containing protein n=1 Tax=Kibdelosporangium aridum TaxID=2030 RepID=A0A1W2B1Q8_KIBAR|nr:GAF and ANTAR domain-containing protein [Kibdelosporangium aridum]SMC66869.1 ANTAR domain-containing protein [Kibdelosporangium aridum]